MLILVANLGSTSFKFRLFHMDGTEERMLAKGGYERVTDYDAAIDQCMQELQAGGHLSGKLDAVGFKTVLGRELSGCVPADEKAIAALDGFKDIAPAHNPPYARGIESFRRRLPEVRLFALFETAFYQWVPDEATRYAVPKAWHEAGLRRYGFHGASHKFIAERSAELLGRADVAGIAARLYCDGPRAPEGKPLRVISCHLGGSSSVTGILNGVAIGTSMGLSPQSGLPQNNRVGDLDSMAIPFLTRALGLDLAEIEKQLSKDSGLLGLSGGVGNDIRDIYAAAAAGNSDAVTALSVFVHEIRRWIGAYWIQMGGCDALVFTAGIGENGDVIRARVCDGLSELGLVLDAGKNTTSKGIEAELTAAGSRTRIFTIPANEELVVAREVFRQVA
ncbi:MAG: acetate/propionate family kinase [Verrucomicrobiales bacterium]